MEKKMANRWQVVGDGVIHPEFDAPLLRDRHCSPENLHLVADALNAYPAYRFILGVFRRGEYLSPKHIQDILEIIGEK
jgi:hypothetical protein